MKKLLLLLIFPSFIQAQDSLVQKNDSVKLVRILSNDLETIFYKMFDSIPGTPLRVHKSEIRYIRYSNGVKENVDSAFTSLTHGRDLLVMKSEPAKGVIIKEITDETVKYKAADNPDGPLYVVQKSQVEYIRYSNGFKENIDSLYRSRSQQQVLPPSPERSYGERDLYAKGMRDANVYYRNKGGSVAVGVVTLFLSVIGLIPAIVVSATPPKEKNLGYPRFELWKSREYQSGYKYTAKKIKQRRVWTAFGVGLAGSIILNALLQQ